MTTPKDERDWTIFVQEAIDYGITGTRRWDDLTGPEQDEYLLACFMGEDARFRLEKKFDLLDRTASSVADALLGPFRQYDINVGAAHYQPESPDRAQRVQTMRMAVLRGTPLGERFSRARSRQARARTASEELSSDPKLRFYSVGPRDMVGLEILEEDEYGGLPAVNPYHGTWNDWAALELQQAKELASLKNERWEREMAAPPPPPLVQSSLAASPQVSSQPSALVAERARPSRTPQFVAGAMLAWALLPFNPYAYYTILRWVCSIIFLHLALGSTNKESRRWAIAFAATAIVYNPLFPLALGRATWSVVNVATIAVLFAHTFLGRRNP